MKHLLLGLLAAILLPVSAQALTVPLKQGDSGPAVQELQQALNAVNIPVAATGPGSPGEETTYFGQATFQAVKRFQEAFAETILSPLNLSQGTGFVGTNTAAVLNSLLAAAGAPKTTTGALLLKRTGPDGYTASAPTTAAGLNEAVLSSANPLTVSALAPTAYTAYSSNVPGYSATAGTCLYSVGRKECAVADTSFTLQPTCAGTLCSLPTKVQAGKVTKVVFKYTRGLQPSPSPTVSPTPTPTVSPSPTPTVTPTVTPTPIAGSCSSVTQYGITWTFDRAYSCGQFVNGDWWVVGPVVITSITPSYNSLTREHGWEVNPSSFNYQGFDGDANAFDSARIPSLPYTAQQGSSIVKSVSITSGLGTHCDGGSNGKTCLDTAAVLTVLGSQPPANSFRPPYFGTAKPLFSANAVNMGVLPRLPSTPAIDPQIISLELAKANIERVQLMHKVGWTGDQIHPKQNFGNSDDPYGPRVSNINADSFMRMLIVKSGDSEQLRKDVAIALIQYGIDVYAARSNGALWSADGGHDLGYKLPLTFAAFMLNDPTLKSAVQNAPRNAFAESDAIHPTASTRASVPLWGQDRFWGDPETIYWGDLVNRATKTLTDPYGFIDGGSTPGGVYQGCCTSAAYKGSALAVRLVPAMQPIWNDDSFLTYTDRWVTIGAYTQPDPCAPVSQGGGPDPAHPGQCILDPDLVPGSTFTNFSCQAGRQCGRFPELNNTSADTGIHRSAFVDAVWASYRSSFLPPAAPVLSFSSSAIAATSGQTVTLTWSAANASYCTASNGWTGAKPTSGIETSAPITAQTVFTITCTGPGGSVNKSIAVIIPSSGSMGPIVSYSFDQSTISGATVADQSGNGNNGTAVSGPAIVAGHSGEALNFNGTTSYVTAGSKPNPALALTLSAWIKPTNIANGGAIIERGCTSGSADTDDFALRITGTSLVFVLSDGNIHLPGLYGGTLQNNVWQHVAATFNGQTSAMYINGAQVASANGSLSSLNLLPTYGKGNLIVGGDANCERNYFLGAIDDVKVYDRALSASEIQTLYAGN